MKIQITILSVFIVSLIFCSKPANNVKPSTGVPKDTSSMTLSMDKAPIKPFQPVPSIINVPLEIKTDVAAKMINEQIKGLLYECDTLTLGGVKPVKVKVWKKDSIMLSLNGDELHYSIPLRIWMQFSFNINALGMNHTEYQDVEASIMLKFHSRLFVKNDWKIVTMTKSDGYEWLSDPVVRVRFLTIPIKPVADLLLSKQTNSFGDMIDKAVTSMVDIKKMISPLWNKMQTPILLAADPDSLWLRLTPHSVYMTQLEGRDNVIRSSIGIKSVAETFFGSNPGQAKADSLPEFVIPGKIDSTFVINLYSELSFASVSQMARSMLAGKSFELSGREIIIQDINLYGLEGYAILSIDLIGAYNGKIYAIGKVIHDKDAQTVEIGELEFDLSTQNRLHKTAEWMFHGLILSKVKPFLKFSIKDKLLESQLMVQKMLSNNQIFKNVYVNGTIDSLSIGGITCTESCIQTILLTKGTLNLHIRN
jgi:hypothetical protein